MKQVMIVILILGILIGVGQLEVWKCRDTSLSSSVVLLPTYDIYKCPVCGYEFKEDGWKALYMIDGEYLCPECMSRIIRALMPTLKKVEVTK